MKTRYSPRLTPRRSIVATFVAHWRARQQVYVYWLGYGEDTRWTDAATRATSHARVRGTMGADCATKHVTGACKSWIDDELDALGEEGAHIPRPSGCCEKDAAERAEATRMIGELLSQDRTNVRTTIAREATHGAEYALHAANADDDDEDDWAKTDDDEDDDGALRAIQEARLRELKGAAAVAAAEARRARYFEIKESALHETLRASTRVVVHFVLEGAEQCARIDEVCDGLAPVFPKTKFVRIRPRDDSAAMRKYGIAALPAVLVFKRGRLMFSTCALDDFGGADNFDEERVLRWLAKHDAIPGHPFADNTKTVDSDASSDDENAQGDDDDELFGVNAPCETCGRTYPHKHIRALRHGESLRQPDDSDSDDGF